MMQFYIFSDEKMYLYNNYSSEKVYRNVSFSLE